MSPGQPFTTNVPLQTNDRVKPRADSRARGTVAVVTSQRFHMVDLAREISRQGWSVSLISALPAALVEDAAPERVVTVLGWNSLRLLAVRMGRYGAWLPESLFQTLEQAAQRELGARSVRHVEGADVVDALSGWGLEAGVAVQSAGGRYVCNRGSAHVLWQKRILEEEHARAGITAPFWFPEWLVERELSEYEAADAVAVPSSFARDTFIQEGVPGGKVHVCPYGVDLTRFHAKPWAGDGAFRILFVGTASPRKGIQYLLDAVRPLVERGRAELWLIGAVAPEAKPLLTRYSGLFRAHGFIEQSRLPELMGQGSVLVLPSIEDGFGLVQAQAMACQLPVIATTHTGASDLFTNGVEGFIVPPRDAVAIRDRLEWLIEHPTERFAMGAAGRARVTELGGWESYGRRVDRLYTDLLTR